VSKVGADIVKRMEIYKKRLAEFEREMKAIGIKVKVTASFGKWTSIVEEEGGCER